MKYPVLRLYFRGSDTIIDIPKPFGDAHHDLVSRIQQGNHRQKIIHGQDKDGNVLICDINWSEVSFAAGILVTENERARDPNLIDKHPS